MIILGDIGNTETKICLVNNDKIIKGAVRISWCHLTNTKIPIDQIKERLQNII